MYFTDGYVESFNFPLFVTILSNSHFNSYPVGVYLKEIVTILREVHTMNLILIIAVSFAFLSAILTGGYEDKPGKVKK